MFKSLQCQTLTKLTYISAKVSQFLTKEGDVCALPQNLRFKRSLDELIRRKLERQSQAKKFKNM